MTIVCQCEVCTRIRSWRELGVPDEIREYILAVEMDRDYYKAILDGSWPQARQILNSALDRLEGQDVELH